MKGAVVKTQTDIARNALKKGISICDVVEITGLTREEVEALNDT